MSQCMSEHLIVLSLHTNSLIGAMITNIYKYASYQFDGLSNDTKWQAVAKMTSSYVECPRFDSF